MAMGKFDRSADHRPGSATTSARQDCLFQASGLGAQQAAVAGAKSLEQGQTFSRTQLTWEDAYVEIDLNLSG